VPLRAAIGPDRVEAAVCQLILQEWSMTQDDSVHADPTEPVVIDEMIESWWADHFPGSAVARDTRAWNVAYAAKETLKRLLKGVL
jgi:hypothetical protein